MGYHAPGQLRRELGFWHLLVFGIVYLAPISAFTMFGFVEANSGGAVVPSFAIAALALGFTAISYGAMAEVEPKAGSTFAYVRLGLGPLPGFIAGWAVLLDYLLLAALVALYAGIFLNASFPAIPTEGWMIAFLGLGLTVNILGIQWSLAADIAVAGLQFLFCMVFAIGGLATLLDGGGHMVPPWPADLPPSMVVSGASVAVITYLGFDAIMTLTEEVKDGNPGRMAGRASLASIFVMMLVFLGINWLLASLGQGLSFPDPSLSAWVVVNERLPSLAWSLSLVAGLALGVGGTTTIHVGVARLIMSMARERQLPSALAKVHPRTRVPWVATVVSMAIIGPIAFLALPHVDLLGGLVSFGALIAFLMVNVAVIVHFGVKKRSKAWLTHWTLPVLGAAVVVYVLGGVKSTTVAVGLTWLLIGLGVYFLQGMTRRRRAYS